VNLEMAENMGFEDILSSGRDLIKNDLELILENIFGNVFVTDKNGELIYLNSSAASSLGSTKTHLLGRTVYQLLDEGILSRSFTAEVMEKRAGVTGVSTSGAGIELLTTSKPIFDSGGNIVMVVTYSQQTPFMDSFLDAVNKEKQENAKYRQAFEYLGASKIRMNKLVINNGAMKRIFETIDLVAKTDSTVVLYGESGVGKDVIASYIHQNSLRSKEPQIPVNCAAIPKELMESEFFGYTRGAFTGANEKGKPGIFELANKGTLFLDEIAELSLDLPAKLLRVLETGEVSRIGSTGAIQKTDVRVIAATNKNLPSMVNRGTFRGDLYYRLSVIPVTIPPLRERKDEIPPLANAFLDQYNRKYARNKVFSEELMEAFVNYRWPGNIRELKNVVERLVLTTHDDTLTSFDKAEPGSHAGAEDVEAAQTRFFPAAEKNRDENLKSAMDVYERNFIQYMLQKSNGNISEAAKRLGIHRSALYKKIKKDIK
jgi:transcriptional regulator with PAS, ATPase and Fis domain